jgi:hypothetical protein
MGNGLLSCVHGIRFFLSFISAGLGIEKLAK